MLKSGTNSKIGRTTSVLRRWAEIAGGSAIEVELVHHFKTDDTVGIELYWHRRFDGLRQGGEWFRLRPQDVAVKAPVVHVKPSGSGKNDWRPNLMPRRRWWAPLGSSRLGLAIVRALVGGLIDGYKIGGRWAIEDAVIPKRLERSVHECWPLSAWGLLWAAAEIPRTWPASREIWTILGGREVPLHALQRAPSRVRPPALVSFLLDAVVQRTPVRELLPTASSPRPWRRGV